MGGVLDNLVAQAQSGAELQQLLKSLKQSESTLYHQGNVAGGVNLLQASQALNFTHHSLACLHILEACNPVAGDLAFISRVSEFFLAASPAQIRLSPEKFVSLAGKLRDAALAVGQSRRVILPLRAAIAALAPSTHFVTPIHAMMLQCCLVSKAYNAGAELVSQEVFDVDPSLTCLTARDYLLYSYYCALIHIGRKQYGSALERLLAVLTAPSMVVNAITLTAYKKYVLVSLIQHGQVQSLPKYTPSSLTRAVKSEAAPYTELANRYTGKTSTPDLTAIVAKHQAEFQQEDNVGLVKLVVESQTKRNVQRLTQTYLTLSLEDIAAAVNLPSAAAAELVILRMIDAGEIFACIDSEKSVVRFLEDPEQYASPAMVQRLDTAIQQSTALAERVSAVAHAVSLEKTYVQKVHLKDRHGRYDEPPELEPPISLGFDAC